MSKKSEYLKKVKIGYYDLDTARIVANTAIANIDRVTNVYIDTHSCEPNKNVDVLFNNVQYEIMKIAIKKEIGE